MENYITLECESVAEYSEKRSRFIARAFPCDSEEKALEILSKIKTECWDARHNVYAYVLKDGTTRFSDDSEPHGTAGKPVLDCITGSGAVDVIVVVTRYSTSAKEALQNAQKVLMCMGTEVSVNCSYSELKTLEKLIVKSEGNITDTVYEDSVTVYFTLKNEDIASFEAELTEAFSGSKTIKKLTEKYFSFKI